MRQCCAAAVCSHSFAHVWPLPLFLVVGHSAFDAVAADIVLVVVEVDVLVIVAVVIVICVVVVVVCAVVAVVVGGVVVAAMVIAGALAVSLR